MEEGLESELIEEEKSENISLKSEKSENENNFSSSEKNELSQESQTQTELESSEDEPERQIEVEKEEESESSDDENNPEKSFPEYANEENKELNIEILKIKKDIKNLDSKIEDFRERYLVMNDHYKNIKGEIKNT